MVTREGKCCICGKVDMITADEETFEEHPRLTEYCGEHVPLYIENLTVTEMSFRMKYY